MATGDGTNFIVTPSMGLTAPTPGVCGALGVEPPGKSWLELVNGSLALVDQHTHMPGFGVAVPSAGLNINADLPFGGYNATRLRSARFSALALASLTASDIGCLVVSGADLYYVDTSGAQIRITSGGGVAGTPGSIGGLVSPAAATYTPASLLFALTSSSGVAAYLSAGPISVTDPVASGKAATISVPSGLAANYGLKLFSGLPAAAAFVTLDATGQLAVGAALSHGITGAMIANNTIGAAQITNGAIGNPQQNFGTPVSATDVATKGYVDGNVAGSASASCGVFTTSSATPVAITNLSQVVTTTGRPILLWLESDGTSSVGPFTAVGTAVIYLYLYRDGAQIASWAFGGNGATGPWYAAQPAPFMDIPGAASHTYAWYMATNASGSCNYLKFAAYRV